MPGVIVVERDRRTGRGVGDVRSAGDGASTVVLVPRTVDCGLVLIVSRRQRFERLLPDRVVGVECELSLIAAGLPIIAASHFRVVAAGHRHSVRLGNRAHR